MAIVSIQNAAAYQPELLDQAIAAHFDTLNVAADLKPGMRVLLKPNLLTGRDPAHAVTTHPAVLAAVARWHAGLRRMASMISSLPTAPAASTRLRRSKKSTPPVGWISCAR